MQTTATKPSLPSIKFLLEPQQNIPHHGNSGLAVATITPTKALIDVTKTDIAQYHFPPTQRKDPRQLPLPPSTLPSIQTDIHGPVVSTPSHGLHSHGHARSYSDTTAYRQPLDFEPSHASHSYPNHYGSPSSTTSPSYLSPHQNQYSYGNSNPHYHQQYSGSRQNLSPPLATPPAHVGARPRPPHNHSRSLSDYTHHHPYATSLPNDSSYLTPVHHEPLRDKPHRFTPSHRRTGSASTIDYMLNNTHISPAPAQASRAPEPSRYTPPIPPSNPTNSATSQDDEQEMDESSSIDGGTHSDRSESPLPSGKDVQGADQNRYVCPYCNKRFSRPSSLRIHTYSHTGEKPFICTEEGCGRKFSVQSNMRRHLRVHRMGRTVKKVRYDGEVEGVRGNSCDNAPGHARGNSGSSLESTGGRDREDGGLHRSGTV